MAGFAAETGAEKLNFFIGHELKRDQHLPIRPFLSPPAAGLR
jgi:hypothetical protein